MDRALLKETQWHNVKIQRLKDCEQMGKNYAVWYMEVTETKWRENWTEMDMEQTTHQYGYRIGYIWVDLRIRKEGWRWEKDYRFLPYYCCRSEISPSHLHIIHCQSFCCKLIIRTKRIGQDNSIIEALMLFYRWGFQSPRPVGVFFMV